MGIGQEEMCSTLIRINNSLSSQILPICIGSDINLKILIRSTSLAILSNTLDTVREL